MELRLLSDADYAVEFETIENELIDQYLEGALPAEERAQFEQYFLNAPERKDALALTAALQKAAEAHASTRQPATRSAFPAPKKQRPLLSFANRWKSRLPGFYLPIAALLLVTIVFGGIWRTYFYQPEVSSGLIALHEAFRDQRPVEVRISGFDYARRTQQRGADRIDELQRERAETLLRFAATEHPGGETHRTLGQYYLAVRQFDKAVEQFKKALSLEPQNARVHSDLGAALLEAGKARNPEAEPGQEIREYAESLEHLNRALELDAALLEARFNRALLYRRMSLLNQAESDWRSYLEKDPASGWADEARQNLREIEEQRNKSSRDAGQTLRDFYIAYNGKDDNRAWELLQRNYTSAGNAITNALLASYLEQEAKSDETTGGELELLAYVGQLEFERSGDSYTANLTRFYRLSVPAQRRGLALARVQLMKGYEQYLLSNFNEAFNYYGQASLAFNEAGSECEYTFTEYLIGLCYVLRFDSASAAPVFERLLLTCAGRGYAWLRGQSLYRVAMLKLHENKYSEAIKDSEKALEVLEHVRDVNGTLKVLILLADQYQSLNDEKRSLGFLQRALSLTGEGKPEPLQVWGIYTALGLNLSSLELYAATLEYQKESVRLALEMGRPLLISRSHAYLGLTYGNLKLYDDALAHIEQAASAGSRLSGDSSGQEMVANTSLYAGEIYRRRGELDTAVEAYDRAINFYARLNFPYFRYAAHKGKLLALLARNDDESIAQELQTVLALFERYRIDMTAEDHRNTFFDVEQSVYDRAMDFAYTRKRDIRLAVEYSELSRARSLLDAIRQGAQVSGSEESPELRLRSASAPLTVSDIQQKMPESAQILQYAVLDDKLLIWVITRSGISTEEVRIGARELEEKVRAYLRTVNRASAFEASQSERAARELYQILISPVEPRLDKARLLCVVPDKILHHLPFGALVSVSVGRYLVEDFRLATAASASVFVECSEEAARKTGLSEETLLSVGDPNFDRAAFASLPPLPSARAEAKAITAYYKPSSLLLGDDAREETVKSKVVKANVANFALHYVVDEQSSINSGMVLAGERRGHEQGDGEDGVWRVYEIYRMRLPQTRLVVLSACQTGVEQQYRGEGAISAARPFIAAGVPVVVASLWAVDSDSTARLIVNFHKHRTRDRLPTAEALRRAQLELIKGEDEHYRQPHYWAAFAAIGGYTEF